jgi:hypothetical protein
VLNRGVFFVKDFIEALLLNNEGNVASFKCKAILKTLAKEVGEEVNDDTY